MDQLKLVVIGASAGGVEALQRVVAGLSPDLDAAVLVVLHLSPTARSVLPQILSRAQTLAATYPVDGQKIQPGRIYVAPPDFHLLVGQDQRFVLTKGPRENGSRPAIDPLFRSAASAFRERVVGVILSGTLDDGAAGLLAIKLAGGKAFVQAPAASLFAGMPNRAIEADEVDCICTADEVGRAVADLLKQTNQSSRQIQLEATETSVDALEGDCQATAKPGDRAEFACPDCGGTLWEINEGGVFRFGCRVGHAYSAQNLLDQQLLVFDRAVWSALRALRERSDLSRRLAERFRLSNHPKIAERHDSDASHFTEQAETLIQMMRVDTGAEKNTADEMEQEIMDEIGHSFKTAASRPLPRNTAGDS